MPKIIYTVNAESLFNAVKALVPIIAKNPAFGWKHCVKLADDGNGRLMLSGGCEHVAAVPVSGFREIDVRPVIIPSRDLLDVLKGKKGFIRFLGGRTFGAARKGP